MQSENNVTIEQPNMFAEPEPPTIECELYSFRSLRVIGPAGRKPLTDAQVAEYNAALRSAGMQWRPVQSRTYVLRSAATEPLPLN